MNLKQQQAELKEQQDILRQQKEEIKKGDYKENNCCC